MNQLFVRHWGGIVFAFLIGISVLLPQLLFRASPQYQGIDLLDTDAEEHYVARVNEIYQGDFMLGNTFLAEKDKPYLQPPLGEIIQAGVGKVLFLDLQQAIFVSKFIFPFLIALVLYSLVYIVSRSRLASIVGVASSMFGHLYMSSLGPWLNLIHGVLPMGSYTLYARPINPQISSLIMFAALLLIYRAFFIREKADWWEIAGISTLIAASLYMNPYTFTFLCGVVGLLGLWFLLRHNIARFFDALYVGGVVIVAAIPFFLNYLRLHGSAGYLELAHRQGLVSSHILLFSLWLTIMLVSVLFFWPKVYAKSRIFFIALILSLTILTYQNVLTGVFLFPEHYHWYITKPLLGLMVGMYAAFFLRFLFSNQYVRIALAGFSVFVLFYTSPIFHLSWYYTHPNPQVLQTQGYAPVLAVLKTLPSNQTVWADAGLSQYVSVYTTDNAPNNPYAIYYLNPQTFYEDVLFLGYRLAGETPATILNTFTKERSNVSERIYGHYYRELWGNFADIPDNVIAELAQKYALFYRRPYADIFHELGVAVVVAPADKAAMYEKISVLQPFVVAGSYKLYTVVQ